MEHSVKAYLERLPAEELETFLRRCLESGQGEQYQHILPLVQDILLKKHGV